LQKLVSLIKSRTLRRQQFWTIPP